MSAGRAGGGKRGGLRVPESSPRSPLDEYYSPSIHGNHGMDSCFCSQRVKIEIQDDGAKKNHVNRLYENRQEAGLNFPRNDCGSVNSSCCVKVPSQPPASPRLVSPCLYDGSGGIERLEEKSAFSRREGSGERSASAGEWRPIPRSDKQCWFLTTWYG